MKFCNILLAFVFFAFNLCYAQTEFPGWPRIIRLDHLRLSSVHPPALENVDSSPGLETTCGFHEDSVYVCRTDGSGLPGWPLVPTWRGIWACDMPCIGDVDGDGEKDILISMNENLIYHTSVFAYRKDGTLLNGWPCPIAPGGTYNPSLADLDKDGKLETVVVPLFIDTCIYVVDDNGRFLPGWPKVLPAAGPIRENLTGPAAIGDLDLDGYPDIVVASEFHLYAWSHDGTPLPGFPVDGPEGWYLGAGGTTHLVLSDLEQDGNLEILISADRPFEYPEGMLCVWRSNGEPMPGFPLILDVSPSCSPIPCDIDKDGLKEIILCTYYAGEGYPNIHVFRHDGTYQPGWPIYFQWKHHFRDPVVGDVNNDGWAEIILTDNAQINLMGRYYAYDRHGSLVPGYPKEIMGFAGSPTLGDVDLNDSLDLAMTTDLQFWDSTHYCAHLYNMETPYNPFLIHWGKQGHDNYNTNNTEFGLLFKPGDANHDGGVDIVDVVYLIEYIFRSGRPPYPPLSGDANSDTLVDIVDVVYIIKYVLMAGPPPVEN